MTGTPKISVVIITYNFERYLRECIESILAQTLKPYEIIISDDHSVDNSWNIISEFSQQFPELIKAYQHEKNLGVFQNGTFGGEMARGDFICLMDGDDRWLPRKLELEWEALKKNPGAQIAYSNVCEIDEAGNRTGIYFDGKGNVPPSGDVFIDVLSRQLFPSHEVFRNELVSRLAFDQEGHCDESLKSFWDWDRTIRYAARFGVAYSGEALVERRMHQEGFSRNQLEVHLQAFVQVYEKHLSLLASRPPEDVLRVLLNVETRIVDFARKLSISKTTPWLARYTPNGVLSRIMPLFRAVPRTYRRTIESEFAKTLARIAFAATNAALVLGESKVAFRNYRFLLRYVSIADPKCGELGIRVLLTDKGYQLLRKAYWRLTG